MSWKQSIIAFVTLAVSIPVFADDPTPPGPATGWHVVRPGENLEIITNYYLGDPAAWPENAVLNPGVTNPHLIFPGQRVKVLLHRGIPSGSAQLTEIGTQVDQQPTPIDWRNARTEDLLRERDGLRTGSSSSAQLRFADGTNVTVSEDSLLFLRGDASLARPLSQEPQEVEILIGQADLSAALVDRSQPPVEVVLGQTKAKPKPSPAGSLATRARRPQAGGAQVMVFEGESSVESGGQAIAVAAGMGTVVPEAGPPEPPVRLLPAPQLGHPTAGLDLDFANPQFTWTPVEDAESYVVEVCGDPECGELVVRKTGLRQTLWQVASLSPGDRFWRVTAVADTGLDGYPSESRAIGIRSDRLEKVEPSARIVASGLHAGLGTALVLATDTVLEAEITDPSGGAAYIEPTLDGESVSMEQLASGWELGSHVAGGTLVSGQGERLPLADVPFIYDTVAPRIDWQVGEGDRLSDLHGLDQDKEHKKPKRKIDTHIDVPLLWSVDGIEWLPLLEPGQSASTFDINCDEPQFFVWTREHHPFGTDPALTLRRGEILRIEAADEHSAIAKMTLRTSRTTSGFEVVVDAVDLVENASSARFLLE